MAFFCEKETALRLFRDGADAYYQQSKYDVGALVQAQSPPKEGKLPYSRSLEHYSSLLTGDSSKLDGNTKQNVNKQQSSGQNSKCKIITFDSETPNNVCLFASLVPSNYCIYRVSSLKHVKYPQSSMNSQHCLIILFVSNSLITRFTFPKTLCLSLLQYVSLKQQRWR